MAPLVRDPEKLARMEQAVRVLIQGLGEDLEREGLRDTPKRVAKALLDCTHGYHQETSSTLGTALFHEPIVHYGGEGIVLVRDIDFASTNEETLLPFHGRCHVAYRPKAGVVLGLSKLARLTKQYAKRLQSQERLAVEVALALQQSLECHGVAVVLQARHLCSATRPEEHSNACVSGVFATKNSAQLEELLTLLSLDDLPATSILQLEQLPATLQPAASSNAPIIAGSGAALCGSSSVTVSSSSGSGQHPHMVDGGVPAPGTPDPSEKDTDGDSDDLGLGLEPSIPCGGGGSSSTIGVALAVCCSSSGDGDDGGACVTRPADAVEASSMGGCCSNPAPITSCEDVGGMGCGCCDAMEAAATVLLEEVGEDPHRRGLAGSARRYVAALLRSTAGYQQQLGLGLEAGGTGLHEQQQGQQSQQHQGGCCNGQQRHPQQERQGQQQELLQQQQDQGRDRGQGCSGAASEELAGSGGGECGLGSRAELQQRQHQARLVNGGAGSKTEVGAAAEAPFAGSLPGCGCCEVVGNGTCGSGAVEGDGMGTSGAREEGRAAGCRQEQAARLGANANGTSSLSCGEPKCQTSVSRAGTISSSEGPRTCDGDCGGAVAGAGCGLSQGGVGTLHVCGSPVFISCSRARHSACCPLVGTASDPAATEVGATPEASVSVEAPQLRLPLGSDAAMTMLRLPFTSQCEHHMLPFYGTLLVSYISPAATAVQQQLLPAAAVQRIVSMYTQRLQVQERITHQVADAVAALLLHQLQRLPAACQGGSLQEGSLTCGATQPAGSSCCHLLAGAGMAAGVGAGAKEEVEAAHVHVHVHGRRWGVMVVCDAAHMCMVARGVENHSGSTTTVAVRGVFGERAELRRRVLRAFRKQ